MLWNEPKRSKRNAYKAVVTSLRSAPRKRSHGIWLTSSHSRVWSGISTIPLHNLCPCCRWNQSWSELEMALGNLIWWHQSREEKSPKPFSSKKRTKFHFTQHWIRYPLPWPSVEGELQVIFRTLHLDLTHFSKCSDKSIVDILINEGEYSKKQAQKGDSFPSPFLTNSSHIWC